jgi:hypothetical protein
LRKIEDDENLLATIKEQLAAEGKISEELEA